MKRSITFLLSVILAMSALSLMACSDDGKAVPGGDNEKVVMLNSFEDFNKDVQGIRLFNGFGTVNHNKDEKYVKSGGASIQLRPVGEEFTTSLPYIVVPTFSIKYDYGYGDFSQVDKVTVQVYNAEDTEISMGLGLAGITRTHQFVEQAIRSNAEYYTLQPGWNLVEYCVEPAYLSLQNIGQAFSVKDVYGIFFEFERQGDGRSLKNANEIYLDDVRLHYGEEEKPLTKDFGLACDTEKGVWELADFENSLQNMFLYIPYTNPSTVLGLPTLRTVNAAKYNTVAKSGVNVLELTKRAGVTTAGAAYVMFSEKVMQQAFANVGDDIKANPQKYALKFEIYNTSSQKDSLSIEYVSDSAYDTDSNFLKTYLSSSTRLEPKTWTSYSINISDIDASITKKAEEKGLTPILFSEHPGRINFSFSQYYGSVDMADKVLLLDNFRIEKLY